MKSLYMPEGSLARMLCQKLKRFDYFCSTISFYGINPTALRTAKTHRVLAILSAIGLNAISAILDNGGPLTG